MDELLNWSSKDVHIFITDIQPSWKNFHHGNRNNVNNLVNLNKVLHNFTFGNYFWIPSQFTIEGY